MENRSTRKLVLAALFAALICVMTLFVKMPVPGNPSAYVHAGDGFIYTAAVIMGGPLAAAAAAVGSILADLLGGYAIYMPATFIIKGVMGFIVGIAHTKSMNWKLAIVLMISASMVMVLGYALYELFLLNLTWENVLLDIYFNLGQGLFGVIIGLPLAMLVSKITPASWKETLK